MANVTLTNITKSFGAISIIPNLNLTIADREFVVLVGPSGCGKTTALRMIAGLEASSGGKIEIGGRNVTQERPGLRNCAMVFQNYALYPHMTVAANIGYGMKTRGHTAEAVQAATLRAAGVVGLENLLNRRPKELSGGQRQRVAIARALVREPDVFLFDEPLSNLDAKLRVEMRAEIKKLHRRLQTTMIYVTHDQIEAMTLADRVVVMNGGRIEQAADPMTLYERPVNQFVAAFIGAPSMNFCTASIERQGDNAQLRLQDGAILHPDPADLPALLQQTSPSITVGIRPEHLHASPTGPIKMLVEAVETLGSHKLLLGTLTGKAFCAQVTPDYVIAADGIAHLSPQPGKLHMFDSSAGQAIRAT